MTDDDSYLPKPHPSFADHFTDPIYDDPSDDLAPFGSDEAADEVYEWVDRGIGRSATLSELLAVSFDADAGTVLEEWDGEDDADDAVLIALGFLLLRVNGHLEAEGRVAVDAALERRQERYGATEPQLVRAREDLASFDQ